MKALILATAVLMVVTAAQAGRQPWQVADRHCDPPKQPPGTGDSLATWQMPKDCPLTKDERATKERCKTLAAGDRPRVCWAYGLQ